MAQESMEAKESPEYLRTSLAAAMTLGFVPGLFYRQARLGCINLLLTYSAGCAAKCAYCGLSKKRTGQYEKKSFIRVSWPTYALDEIIERIHQRQSRVKRICISMITHGQCVKDTKTICARLRSEFDIPVSILAAPTIINRNDLMDFKAAGADKIGVAIDLATPELFDKYRGAGVGGPHVYENYIERLKEAVEIFGPRNAGSHFVTGMGETEKEMVQAMQQIQDMGGWTHLFSFYPEAESQLSNHPIPAMDHYRRIQVARYLLDEKISRAEKFVYGDNGQVIDFGVTPEKLAQVIDCGEPFRTSGCPGYDGEVACNRPYANSRPGDNIRNYPFAPEPEDIERIRSQMGIRRVSTTRDEDCHVEGCR